MKIFNISIKLIIYSTLVIFSIWGLTNFAQDNDSKKIIPNLENGLRIYEKCALCHTPMGWGSNDGHFAQIAGQYVNVIIKQITDMRNHQRDNLMMSPFTQSNFLGGDQNMLDVATYISRLPMSPHNEVGPGINLERGNKLYREHCAKCHGQNGEGSNEDNYPRIQGQHFSYLLRQFNLFKHHQRHNADIIMIKELKNFDEHDILVITDFISRLRPSPELIAPDNWYNPDFQLPLIPNLLN